MISKSPKDLYKTVSQNLAKQGYEIDEDTARRFNLFLFGKIKRMMQSLEHLEIYVPKLGIWKARKMKMIEFTGRKSGNEQGIREIMQGHPEEVVQQALERYLSRQEKLKVLIAFHDEMLEERKKFKEEKRYGLKSDKADIQESQQDMGRIKEQSV